MKPEARARCVLACVATAIIVGACGRVVLDPSPRPYHTSIGWGVPEGVSTSCGAAFCLEPDAGADASGPESPPWIVLPAGLTVDVADVDMNSGSRCAVGHGLAQRG